MISCCFSCILLVISEVENPFIYLLAVFPLFYRASVRAVVWGVGGGGVRRIWI